MEAERVVLRRRHSAELKTLVLEQCAAPGASVTKVAMSHGVNANIVHGWPKLESFSRPASTADLARPEVAGAGTACAQRRRKGQRPGQIA